VDRRKHPRFIKRLKTIFSSDGKSSTGVSSNLSENGLFIRTRNSFVPDTIIDIGLLMSDGRKSFLKGQVKWAFKMPLSTFKNGMGVELIEKDTTYINFLESLTEEAMKEEVSIEPRLSIGDADICIFTGRYDEAMDTYIKLFFEIEPGNARVLQRIEELKTLLKLLGKDSSHCFIK